MEEPDNVQEWDNLTCRENGHYAASSVWFEQPPDGLTDKQLIRYLLGAIAALADRVVELENNRG